MVGPKEEGRVKDTKNEEDTGERERIRKRKDKAEKMDIQIPFSW
jgi:hypothetical protein